MTPQEEQLLVQIIVQCVRAVLENSSRDTQQPAATVQNEPANNASRFINVVPGQVGGRQNGNAVTSTNGSRNDVRHSLQRFLRSSESQMSSGDKEKKTVLQNGLVTKSNPGPTPPEQKRQLITQADVLAAKQEGQTTIVLQPGAIVTPLARQIAKEKGVDLR